MIQGVRYDLLNTLLVNELQKQARQNSAQEKQIEALAAQGQQANTQAQQVEALTARLVELEAAVGAQQQRPAVPARYKPGKDL